MPANSLTVGRNLIRFIERPGCPCCESRNSTVTWSGRFSDPNVAGFMAQFHYNADVAAALGDQSFELLTCTDCGMRYHRYVMSEEWVPVVYGQWTDSSQIARFEAAHGAGRDKPFQSGVQRLKLLLRLRELVQRNRAGEGPIQLLDFGCGDGQLLVAAQVLGFQAIGIDVSATRADTSRRSGLAVFPDLAAFAAQCGDLMDAVVLSQVLEHLTDPLGLLRALAQRMRPGGVLHVAVPNCDGMATPKDFNTFHHLQPLEHVNAFTPDSLQRLVVRAGFERVRVPMACVSSRLGGVIRSIGGLAFRPRSTDQYFRLT